MPPISRISTPEYLHVSGRNCPECGDQLDRIPRRFQDRVTGLFAASHRYRCRGFGCRWEGNLRDPKERRDSGASPAQ